MVVIGLKFVSWEKYGGVYKDDFEDFNNRNPNHFKLTEDRIAPEVHGLLSDRIENCAMSLVGIIFGSHFGWTTNTKVGRDRCLLVMSLHECTTDCRYQRTTIENGHIIYSCAIEGTSFKILPTGLEAI